MLRCDFINVLSLIRMLHAPKCISIRWAVSSHRQHIGTGYSHEKGRSDEMGRASEIQHLPQTKLTVPLKRFGRSCASITNASHDVQHNVFAYCDDSP